MTVSLHTLIEEWEEVNAELCRVSQESHRRYPFPGYTVADAESKGCATDGSASSLAPTFSTATYARVYSLLSRVRHIAEDARYNSSFMIQQLLWVTMVAWANQLATASGGLVRLPDAMRQHHKSSAQCATRGRARDDIERDRQAAAGPAAPVQRAFFACALLPSLELWDPSVLREAAAADTPVGVSGADHHGGSSSSNKTSFHRAPNLPEVWSTAVRRIFARWCATSNAGLSDTRPDDPTTPTADTGTTATTATTSHRAHVWVLVAQHYHRFKALLSLFFLRYNVLLEEAEEHRTRSVGAPSPPPTPAPPHHTSGTTSPLPPSSVLLRRRGGPQRVSSFSGSSSGDGLAVGSSSAAAARHRTPASCPPTSSSFASTGRLMEYLMRSIAHENIATLHVVISEAALLLLLPRSQRASLRRRVAETTSTAAAAADDPDDDVGSSGGSGSDEDDQVAWSSPPSPLLLSHVAPAATAGDCHTSFIEGTASSPPAPVAPPAASPAAGRAQQEEYTRRKIFTLLRMAEDCHLHEVQRWLVEEGRHLTSVHGAQLATTLLGDGAGAQRPAAATAGALTDANRILREMLLGYVRLRAKLLFLNAGTTHYIAALTPWGRTHVLESISAFLCGLSGVVLPASSAAVDEKGAAVASATAAATTTTAAAAAAALLSSRDTAVCVTAAHSAVSDFVGTWGVQLWIAMCDEARQRMEAQQLVEVRRTQRLCLGPSACQPGRHPDDGAGAAGGVGSLRCSDDAGRSPSRGRHSVASTELDEVASYATSAVWPPRSPTGLNGSGADGNRGGAGSGDPPIARRRGRGMDLKRVLQQAQTRRHRTADVKAPRRGVTAGRVGAVHASEGDGISGAARAGHRAGAELSSVDDDDDDSDGTARATFPDRQTTSHAAPFGGRPAATRFSRSAQLHQAAAAPDDGFPSLLYLMPRRSRFTMQDRVAAAVQQQLFTRFSSDVQAYLSNLLREEDASEAAAAAAKDPRAALKEKKRRKRRSEVAGTTSAGRGADVEDAVVPLPPTVLARMVYLLEMSYAALEGRGGTAAAAVPGTGAAAMSSDGPGGADAQHRGPLMETGLTTATGEEVGGAAVGEAKGEFESVASTTVAAPASPALLSIAAARKGFHGFLATVEKRAALTLAQALHGLVQQGSTAVPPAAPLQAVDTILNMASLLNSKDMFVLLLKGYLAPQVMMCRTLSELAVESQVVGRLAYRLGAAVAAPCLTLLRDLRLAMSEPHSVASPLRPSGAVAGFPDERELNDAYVKLQRDRGDERGVGDGETTADGAQLVATRDAETLAAVSPLRHGAFGLIHRVRVLCHAWWHPHTAVLLPSRRLRQLWERHRLLDERIVDAVLRVEWQYDGHVEPFAGYGQCATPACDGDRVRQPPQDGGVASMRSSLSDVPMPSRPRRSDVHEHASALAAAGTQLRAVAAAAVARGLSSALGNAVRRTGRQAGDFGYHDSDNESEDYSEAYGGLLTLSTLQQYRNAYAPSNSSFRGSNLSSIGGHGGGGGEHWEHSDGGQSTIADDRASTTVPPGGQLERRRLRWPLGDGQLIFYLYSKGASGASRSISRAVQVSGPPLTLLVCQLLDRASEQLYTFDALHKALAVDASKPLLAHLLHELVKANLVVRSVAAGTRQLTYRLRDDVHELCHGRITIDVRAAAQQQWVARTTAMSDADADDNSLDGSVRDAASPASPVRASHAFPKVSLPTLDHAAPLGGTAKSMTTAMTTGAAAGEEPSSPTYSADRAHKVKVSVVRIMKAERVLSHHELLERVALTLENQFVVTPGQLKRCVAHLIEKEFLTRGEQGEYMFVS
ncbi:Cullin protein neddylation domain containing protein [Novymonas esmeraldas]|uniref:Cullin protein neddylation domain containing protein n=1 Tax=Novymonas esmeraldas TaxID=1808958 RepID=A0AAW0F467_9TRYP